MSVCASSLAPSPAPPSCSGARGGWRRPTVREGAREGQRGSERVGEGQGWGGGGRFGAGGRGRRCSRHTPLRPTARRGLTGPPCEPRHGSVEWPISHLSPERVRPPAGPPSGRGSGRLGARPPCPPRPGLARRNLADRPGGTEGRGTQAVGLLHASRQGGRRRGEGGGRGGARVISSSPRV